MDSRRLCPRKRGTAATRLWGVGAMKGYRKYFGKMIIWFIITFIVALLLNFILPRLMPGDPVAAMTAKQAQGLSEASAVKAIYDNYAREFGTDKPMTEQFVTYIGNLFHGDMGTSFSQYPRKVSNIIGNAFIYPAPMGIVANTIITLKAVTTLVIKGSYTRIC